MDAAEHYDALDDRVGCQEHQRDGAELEALGWHRYVVPTYFFSFSSVKAFFTLSLVLHKVEQGGHVGRVG